MAQSGALLLRIECANRAGCKMSIIPADWSPL